MSVRQIVEKFVSLNDLENFSLKTKKENLSDKDEVVAALEANYMCVFFFIPPLGSVVILVQCGEKVSASLFSVCVCF